jgi:hypothetical protein
VRGITREKGRGVWWRSGGQIPTCTVVRVAVVPSLFAVARAVAGEEYSCQ